MCRPERERVRTATGEYGYVCPPDASADSIAWSRLSELVRTSAGTVIRGRAVLRVAVVDEVGQLP